MTIFVCAVPTILKERKAYAQAVGQQAKEIDTKVCAKKVWKAKGGGTEAARDAAVAAKNGRWSCVDYSGTSAHGGPGDIKDGHGFGWRFGDVTLNESRQDKDATGQNDDANGRGQTNAGWPGTASGKTDTADGMAGDLSKALDRGQRNKVAGLLSKTVSGAEVVERSCVQSVYFSISTTYSLCNNSLVVSHTLVRKGKHTKKKPPM